MRLGQCSDQNWLGDQDTYARIQSIFREGGEAFREVPQWSELKESSERSLLFTLCRFRSITKKSGQRLQPYMLCNYLYEVCKEFNRMYAVSPVLKAETPGLKAARLELLRATALILQSGLSLLGISTLERM